MALAAALLQCPSSQAGGLRVEVPLPVPAKIDTTHMKTILVARFLGEEVRGVDPNKEFVRFVRHELSKDPHFTVLDVEPPALPEQPVEDLLRNTTFWKHVAEEFGADLVVSGEVRFTNADRSGFVQEDFISPVTGQKVREARFVEREEFALEARIWFFKGGNGVFLYEDTFRDTQVYDGKSNDALMIFHGLAERMAGDIHGVVSPQVRTEPRYIFDE